MTLDHDPTKIDLTIEGGALDPATDPFSQWMNATAIHGNAQFSVPFISHIEGQLYTGGCAQGLVIPDVIDSICSLYRWEHYTIPDHRDVDLLEVTMFDAVGEVDGDLVEGAVDWVLHRMSRGCNVLVHCQAGLNRSGMVGARVLVELGHEPRDAINLLRAKRSPVVLCNEDFEQYVLRTKRKARK